MKAGCSVHVRVVQAGLTRGRPAHSAVDAGLRALPRRLDEEAAHVVQEELGARHEERVEVLEQLGGHGAGVQAVRPHALVAAVCAQRSGPLRAYAAAPSAVGVPNWTCEVPASRRASSRVKSMLASLLRP